MDNSPLKLAAACEILNAVLVQRNPLRGNLGQQALRRANKLVYQTKPSNDVEVGHWEASANPNFIEDFVGVHNNHFQGHLQVSETAFCADVEEALNEAAQSAFRTYRDQGNQNNQGQDTPTHNSCQVGAIFWNEEQKADGGGVLAVAVLSVTGVEQMRLGLFSFAKAKPTLKLFQTIELARDALKEIAHFDLRHEDEFSINVSIISSLSPTTVTPSSPKNPDTTHTEKAVPQPIAQSTGGEQQQSVTKANESPHRPRQLNTNNENSERSNKDEQQSGRSDVPQTSRSIVPQTSRSDVSATGADAEAEKKRRAVRAAKIAAERQEIEALELALKAKRNKRMKQQQPQPQPQQQQQQQQALSTLVSPQQQQRQKQQMREQKQTQARWTPISPQQQQQQQQQQERQALSTLASSQQQKQQKQQKQEQNRKKVRSTPVSPQRQQQARSTPVSPQQQQQQQQTKQQQQRQQQNQHQRKQTRSTPVSPQRQQQTQRQTQQQQQQAMSAPVSPQQPAKLPFTARKPPWPPVTEHNNDGLLDDNSFANMHAAVDPSTQQSSDGQNKATAVVMKHAVPRPAALQSLDDHTLNTTPAVRMDGSSNRTASLAVPPPLHCLSPAVQHLSDHLPGVFDTDAPFQHDLTATRNNNITKPSSQSVTDNLSDSERIHMGFFPVNEDDDDHSVVMEQGQEGMSTAVSPMSRSPLPPTQPAVAVGGQQEHASLDAWTRFRPNRSATRIRRTPSPQLSQGPPTVPMLGLYSPTANSSSQIRIQSSREQKRESMDGVSLLRRIASAPGMALELESVVLNERSRSESTSGGELLNAGQEKQVCQDYVEGSKVAAVLAVSGRAPSRSSSPGAANMLSTVDDLLESSVDILNFSARASPPPPTTTEKVAEEAVELTTPSSLPSPLHKSSVRQLPSQSISQSSIAPSDAFKASSSEQFSNGDDDGGVYADVGEDSNGMFEYTMRENFDNNNNAVDRYGTDTEKPMNEEEEDEEEEEEEANMHMNTSLHRGNLENKYEEFTHVNGEDSMSVSMNRNEEDKEARSARGAQALLEFESADVADAADDVIESTTSHFNSTNQQGEQEEQVGAVMANNASLLRRRMAEHRDRVEEQDAHALKLAENERMRLARQVLKAISDDLKQHRNKSDVSDEDIEDGDNLRLLDNTDEPTISKNKSSNKNNIIKNNNNNSKQQPNEQAQKQHVQLPELVFPSNTKASTKQTRPPATDSENNASDFTHLPMLASNNSTARETTFEHAYAHDNDKNDGNSDVDAERSPRPFPPASLEIAINDEDHTSAIRREKFERLRDRKVAEAQQRKALRQQHREARRTVREATEESPRLSAARSPVNSPRVHTSRRDNYGALASSRRQPSARGHEPLSNNGNQENSGIGGRQNVEGDGRNRMVRGGRGLLYSTPRGTASKLGMELRQSPGHHSQSQTLAVAASSSAPSPSDRGSGFRIVSPALSRSMRYNRGPANAASSLPFARTTHSHNKHEHTSPSLDSKAKNSPAAPSHRNINSNKSGPRLTRPSNRKVIHNALTHVCLAGPLHRQLREEVLSVLEDPHTDHFVALFHKSVTLKYRALYAVDEPTLTLSRLHGKGPLVLDSHNIQIMLKYNTGQKAFQELAAKTLTRTTDGIVVYSNQAQAQTDVNSIK